MTDQIIPGDLLARAKVIGGLRQLADYIENHLDLPVCTFGWDVRVYPTFAATEAERRAEVDRIACVLGAAVTDETRGGGHYTTARNFGFIRYEAVCVADQRRAAHAALMSYDGCVTPDGRPVAEVTE